MKTLLLTALLFSIPLSTTGASMYVCTDAKGNKTYTQSPSSHCQSVSLGKPSTYSSAPLTSKEVSPSMPSEPEASTSPPSVVTLGESEQIIALRRKLEAAKKALAEGKKVRYGNERNYAKYLERIADLEKAVKEIEAELMKAQGTAGNF